MISLIIIVIILVIEIVFYSNFSSIVSLIVNIYFVLFIGRCLYCGVFDVKYIIIVSENIKDIDLL